MILGVLGAASLPRFNHVAQQLRLEQTASAFAQLLRLAHEQAISEAHELTWRWDVDARRAHLEPVDDKQPGEGKSGPLGAGAEGLRVPQDVAVTLEGGAGVGDCQCIHFFPDGTSELATVTVQIREQSYTVSVDAATSQVQVSAGTPPR